MWSNFLRNHSKPLKSHNVPKLLTNLLDASQDPPHPRVLNQYLSVVAVKQAFDKHADRQTQTVNCEQFVEFFKSLDEILGEDYEVPDEEDENDEDTVQGFNPRTPSNYRGSSAQWTQSSKIDSQGNKNAQSISASLASDDLSLKTEEIDIEDMEEEFLTEINKEFDELVAKQSKTPKMAQIRGQGGAEPTITVYQLKSVDWIRSLLEVDALSESDVDDILADIGIVPTGGSNRRSNAVDINRKNYLRAVYAIQDVATRKFDELGKLGKLKNQGDDDDEEYDDEDETEARSSDLADATDEDDENMDPELKEALKLLDAYEADYEETDTDKELSAGSAGSKSKNPVQQTTLPNANQKLSSNQYRQVPPSQSHGKGGKPTSIPQNRDKLMDYADNEDDDIDDDTYAPLNENDLDDELNPAELLQQQATDIFNELYDAINEDEAADGNKAPKEKMLPVDVIMQWADIQELLESKELTLDEVTGSIATVTGQAKHVSCEHFVRILTLLELLIARNRGMSEKQAQKGRREPGSSEDMYSDVGALKRDIRQQLDKQQQPQPKSLQVSSSQRMFDDAWLHELFMAVKDHPKSISVSKMLSMKELNDHIKAGSIKMSQIVALLKKVGVNMPPPTHTTQDSDVYGEILMSEKQFAVCIEQCLETIVTNQAAQSAMAVKSKTSEVAHKANTQLSSGSSKQQFTGKNLPQAISSNNLIGDNARSKQDRLIKTPLEVLGEMEDDDDDEFVVNSDSFDILDAQLNNLRGDVDEDTDDDIDVGSEIDEDRLMKYAAEYESLKSPITDRVSVQAFMKHHKQQQKNPTAADANMVSDVIVNKCKIFGKDMELAQYIDVCENLRALSQQDERKSPTTHKHPAQRTSADDINENDDEEDEYDGDIESLEIAGSRTDEEINAENRKLFKDLAGRVSSLRL
jgi:hypothetical protein